MPDTYERLKKRQRKTFEATFVEQESDVPTIFQKESPEDIA